MTIGVEGETGTSAEHVREAGVQVIVSCGGGGLGSGAQAHSLTNSRSDRRNCTYSWCSWLLAKCTSSAANVSSTPRSPRNAYRWSSSSCAQRTHPRNDDSTRLDFLRDGYASARI